MSFPQRFPKFLLCFLAGIPAASEAQTALNPPSGSGQEKTLFTTLLPEDTGLNFVNPIDISHPNKYLYASSMSTGGVAVGDFDGDGRPDIFLASGPKENALFRQTADWKFENVAPDAGLDGGEQWSVGCSAFDIEGDGDLDIVVANYLTANQLFINNGDGTFTEGAKAAGLDAIDASHTLAPCDYDGDGDLDLYLLTNRWYRPEGFPKEQTIAIIDGRPKILPKWEKYYDAVQTGDSDYSTQVVGRPDRLYRNNGDGTFADVTKEAGITHRGHGLSATWFDYDRDGRPDLWVGSDFDEEDSLYRNKGDGTFEDMTQHALPYTSWFSMGADTGDVNGDGLPDMFTADMAGSNHYLKKAFMGSMNTKAWFMDNAPHKQVMHNCLYINGGDGLFTEASQIAKVGGTNWSWAARLTDLDGDGRDDIYVQAGMARNFNEKDNINVLRIQPGKTQWDRFENEPPLKEPCWAFKNTSGGTKFGFKDHSDDWGLNHVGMSYGCAIADLDLDGDLDIVSVRLDEPVALLRNDRQGGQRIVVQPEWDAPGKNRLGVGCEIVVSAEGAPKQHRTLVSTRGYLGSEAPVAAFGLPENVTQVSVEVLWPDGHRQTYPSLKTGQLHTLTRSGSSEPAPEAKPSLFKETTTLAKAVHEERLFDDFAQEPLLPEKQSHWGPGFALGDIDGDGDIDFFLGAGKSAAPTLFENKEGEFEKRTDNPFAGDILFEDTAAVFLDSDSDGDLDLFIASGGNESPANSSNYQNRLYLNDGSGSFAAAPPGSLPPSTIPTGAVSVSDFDADGDPDLFVGSASLPAAYPTSGASVLLTNEGGRFTQTPLPDLGIVTAALFSDADADGDPDLLITQEWGPVAFFQNSGGKFENATEQAGLADLTGWWKGLEGRDLDGDGDIDYVATNTGTNTKYHANSDHPLKLFYGDLGGTGSSHIVEAKYEDDTLFPVRGLSCSSEAMPFIKEKFGTYRSFAKAELVEIYPQKQLDQVQSFTATVLESGILRNGGDATFTFEPFPWQAQLAPQFGAAATELDGDGFPEIALVGNFSYPQRETTPMNAGLGLLLQGTNSAPRALSPSESGIRIRSDGRGASWVDLNGDGEEVLVVPTNSGPVKTFARRSPSKNLFTLTLNGFPGNPSAAGARISVVSDGLPPQTAESKGLPLTFARKPGAGATATIVWPSGKGSSEHSLPAGSKITISRSDKLK